MTTTPFRLDFNNWTRIPRWEREASYDKFVYVNIHIDEEENANDNDEYRKNLYKIGLIPSAETTYDDQDVKIIDLHNPSRTSQLEMCISSVFDEAAEKSELDGRKTLIHVFYKGPAMTNDGKVTV